MMLVPFQKEDLTTEKLAELLRSSPAALHSFVDFLFPDEREASRYKKPGFKVETQHRFTVGKRGRLDLLIHNGPTGIIVECKTGDRPKVFQLEKYHKYWTEKHGREPSIFWLVRKQAGPMGINPYLTREMLWDQLHEHLQAMSPVLGDKVIRSRVDEFCQYLADAKILLQPDEHSVYTPRNKGYDYQHAELLINKVGRCFDDSTYEVVAPVNSVTHRLFIGRKTWKRIFRDGWTERVTLQFKVDKLSKKLFWHGNIMLYNQHNVADPTIAINQLPRWAPICKEFGLRLLRNPGAEWSGASSYEIEPPYHIVLPVKYFHAPLPAVTWPIAYFETGNQKEMVAEGVKIVEYLYSIVDKF